MANERVLAVGLMSGTSMDGVDAALIETDGVGHVRPLAFVSVPYADGVRAEIRRAIATALSLEARVPDSQIKALETALTRAHFDAIEALKARVDVYVNVKLIGFHGQTIAHKPNRQGNVGGWTWQIGDGRMLAERTGIPVVNDFRSADVAAGGQGAPLIPAYHAAIAASAGLELPVAMVNIGGVGNVTFIPENGDLLAFDTGPGNALVDDWMREHTGQPIDLNGQAAASGAIRPDVLTAMLDNPWFDEAPPKSLDRHDFSIQAARGLGLADGAATLTAFTAETIRLSSQHMPALPKQWLICGGGRRNHTLMRMLSDRLPNVSPIESIGYDGDAIEAQGFAYLAVRSSLGLPISWPGTTGCPNPMTGGTLNRP
jgi:anhydro-N-acetylmuramic acid kinase